MGTISIGQDWWNYLKANTILLYKRSNFAKGDHVILSFVGVFDILKFCFIQRLIFCEIVYWNQPINYHIVTCSKNPGIICKIILSSCGQKYTFCITYFHCFITYVQLFNIPCSDRTIYRYKIYKSKISSSSCFVYVYR